SRDNEEYRWSVVRWPCATSLPMVQLFFFLGLVCYIAFVLGFRTRLFQILSLLFFMSVCNRSLVVRQGVDRVLLTMLFWSVFLPLGARFSVDSIIRRVRLGLILQQRDKEDREPVLSERSLAAFVIVCQIGLIYCLTALSKFGEDWITGTALYYVLHIDQISSPLGKWLAHQPIGVLKALTWGTLMIEYATFPFILLPVLQPHLRRIILVLLTGMHLGIWMTMELGIFPFAMFSTYTLLLNLEDWKLMNRWALRWSKPVTVCYDDTCGFCVRLCQLLAIADSSYKVQFIAHTVLKWVQSSRIGVETGESALR